MTYRLLCYILVQTENKNSEARGENPVFPSCIIAGSQPKSRANRHSSRGLTCDRMNCFRVRRNPDTIQRGAANRLRSRSLLRQAKTRPSAPACAQECQCHSPAAEVKETLT